MNGCNPQLLGAYYDGELSAEDRQQLEQHLATCQACAHSLRLLQKSSQLFKQHSFDDLTGDELKRLHTAVEQSEQKPIYRLGIGLIVAAASVLIVSCAWLLETPAANGPVAGHPSIRRPEPWEQVATSLRPDPLSLIQDDPVRFADAALADWMLAGLNARTPP